MADNYANTIPRSEPGILKDGKVFEEGDASEIEK